MNAKAIGAELEAELRSVLQVWFPRCVDREHGGFLCDFDHRWKPAGAQLKMLEYQARQTLVAARGAAHCADFAPLRQAAEHGFRYLRDTMWDRRYGGWYRLLDRAGQPLEGATKHGHGTGYAISACVYCHELTGNPECLELARQAFAWLEEHAHDPEHGGYFSFYRQDGTPILDGGDAPQSGATRDEIGTPIGFKDANTTCDLLKALADLHRRWPDPLLTQRLEETLRLVRERLIVAPGVMHMGAPSTAPRCPWLARCSTPCCESPGIPSVADSISPARASVRRTSRVSSCSCGTNAGGLRPRV
jgi:mannobiose 2-epimerase